MSPTPLPDLPDLLRTVRRRYRLAPLPATLDAAVAAGSETALAFAMESARLALAGQEPLDDVWRDTFTDALAVLIRRAMAPDEGDPAFQAQVLKSGDAQVREWVRLEAQAASDARAVRAAVDALAHPGKLRRLPEDATRRALASLYARAAAGEWHALASEAAALSAALLEAGAPLRAQVREIGASAALKRLSDGEAMTATPPVLRYRALRARTTPAAGSDAAQAQGRASAREGLLAEQVAASALAELAAFLHRTGDAASPTYRVLRSLRTPRRLSGGGDGSKEEWDAAVVRCTAPGAGDVVLLAEVKAAPAAVTSDMPRLLRGLTRLAQAEADTAYAFASIDGPILLGGASLRALQPRGDHLPEQVIYLCSAARESRPSVLSAAAKGMLFAEPASLAFARALAAGSSPAGTALDPVWQSLVSESRLGGVLRQFDIACRAREAMLHTGDLSATLRALGHGGDV